MPAGTAAKSVEAVELLFLKKTSLFYGFQMHYLML
jgi:hypothetical protein